MSKLLNMKQDFLALSIDLSNDRVDEFGFLVRSEEMKKEAYLTQVRERLNQGRRIGRGYHCKSLCRLMKHYSRFTIALKKSGLFWCDECMIAMGCCRCHCCGRAGRKEYYKKDARIDIHDN